MIERYDPVVGTVVCVVDGAEVERPLDFVVVEHGYSRRVPVLRDNEEIRWVLGDARPHIIKTSAD